MTYNKKSIEDICVKGKKVLVRCDFNVPQDENLNITDETRILGALPTIKYFKRAWGRCDPLLPPWPSEGGIQP